VYDYDRTKTAKKPWWQSMSRRDRAFHVKHYSKRLNQLIEDKIDKLLQRHSAFESLDALRSDMINHGYLPTVKNRDLRKLLDVAGLPYWGQPDPRTTEEVAEGKKPKVIVMLRRDYDVLEMREPYEHRLLNFSLGISDEKLFDDFPWKMVAPQGSIKEEFTAFGQTLWYDVISVKPIRGDTKRDISEMKDDVTQAARKFQSDHPEIDVVLKMRGGVG